jgi:hypothetical protein
MSENYDEKVDQEVERVLKELYNNPMDMGDSGIKRIVIKTEKRHVDYLKEYELIKVLRTASAGKFGIQLESKGYEVFEKYGSWNKYKKQVIEKQRKIERAKDKAVKYWWLPIAISILAFVLSLLSLIKQ